MKVLALDFDGVISDSAPECFWVALRTLRRVRPGSRRGGLLAGWDGLEGPEARAAVSRDPLYQRFLALMPLGNRAEDFGVALLALEAGVELENQAEYDHYFESLDPAFVEDFHGHFYREREVLRSAEPERWGQLMSPYGALIDVLRRRSDAAKFVIATAKDGASVVHLVARYGIGDLFGRGCVIDKQAGRDKRAHLRTAAERFAVTLSDITFIDDKVNHLIRAQQLGVRCLLAAWGYNGPREHALARERGIGVCSLDQFESTVFG